MSIHDDASDLASTSASTGWDLPTPDLTVVSEDVGDAEEQSKKPAYAGSASAETVPVPGNTYVIRARDSGRAITVRNNELKLLEWDSASDKSSHWYCEERGGWLSFKNAVSGRYMGHNGGGVIHAQAGWHLLWEDFTPRKHPDGGFLLLNRGWWWWNPLQDVAIDESSYNLIHASGRGTIWEFLKL